MSAMSSGSIQGLEGWSGGTIPIMATVDQAVDQSGSHQRTGQGAWRISNNTTLGNHNGAFGGWVFGPGLPVSAGQPSSGAGADQFSATVWFHSASPLGDGSNIEIDLGSALGDDRNTFLALTNKADAAGGLQLRASEPDGAGDFRPAVVIAQGISRDGWHRLEIVANFYDGPGNDTVQYALDGAVLANPAGGTTFGTFEDWRDRNSLPYVLSNRLYFRSGAAPSGYGSFVDADAQGFYFDDLNYAVANQSAPATLLAAYATGFEPGMTPGSAQGQEGWSGGIMPISAFVDQTVDQSGSHQRTGTGSLQISNNTSSGNYNGIFGGWVFGPGLPVPAGQPSSVTGGDQFTATLWFRSASASADGSNIEIDLGSVAGDDRNSFLALTNRADLDGGLQLRASEPDGSTGDFLPTAIIATGITRSEWHRLDIVAKFYDGPTNDTIEYALDGTVLANPAGGTTFGTFEGFREGIAAAYVPINRLFFRSGAAPSAYGAFADTAAQGFYFDDLNYAVANQSAPGSPLAAYATGFEPAAVPAPDLTVSASHVGDFVQGQVGAQFTLTVKNSGTPSTLGLVTLIDDVPAGLTPTAASGAGWNCDIDGTTVTCTRSNALAPDASYSPITIVVTVAANAPASVINMATISGGGDVNAANNTASDAIRILSGLSQSDLAVTITDGQTAYAAGMPISYTITVTNGGPSTASNVSIADNVPAMITGLSVTCAVTGTGSCGTNGSSGNSVLFTSADLAAGAGNMLTLTVNGTVSPTASGVLVNTATVGGTTDVNPGNNSASDTNEQEIGVIINEGGDFDGDGKADIAVFRPSTGAWHIYYSGTSTGVTFWWGGVGDIPVPADYDGDGKTDIAVFRPSTSAWYIFYPSTVSASTFFWGGVGDIPVARDYDGDGKADIAVFRPSTGAWHIFNSSTSTGVTFWWGGVGDIPVPADYDGDGKTDIAIFRPSTSAWHIFYPSTVSASTFFWGGVGDFPVARDYDGDGKADIAVFRPSAGAWYVFYPSTMSASTTLLGGVGDIPVAADYDGDGKVDIAVFRPSTSQWFIVNKAVFLWGGLGDFPF